jgi:hypothetical protein
VDLVLEDAEGGVMRRKRGVSRIGKNCVKDEFRDRDHESVPEIRCTNPDM